MTTLADLQHKMQETSAAISRLNASLAQSPSPSLLVNLQSLIKRQSRLEQEFAREAAKIEVDVCDYRMFQDMGGSRFEAAAIADAIREFQRLFSIVYEALRLGPKRRGRVSTETSQDTSFGFAYTYSGSLGVALTLPNERLLAVESYVDEAMRTVFTMMRATEPDAVLNHSKRLGVAPIRALHGWASTHTAAGLGADIQWKRAADVRAGVFVQTPELERLRAAISATSEEEVEEITAIGELVGADVSRRTFHIRLRDGDIRGTFSDAISTNHTVVLPKHYRITLRKTTKVYFSTEREDVDYFLLRIETP